MWGRSALASLLPIIAVVANAAVPTDSIAEPCAILGATLEKEGTPIVPAELAYNCLRSVPVDTDGDIQQIGQLKLFFEWQTDLAYQKNPPATSVLNAVDIYRGLDVIHDNIRLGTYTNEYDVQRDISGLVRSAYNGHLYYYSDIYFGVASFIRDQAAILVSISGDGTALPKVYTFMDVARATKDPSFDLSSVEYINGYDTVTYLSKLATQSARTDASSRYNEIFPNQATLSLGSGGEGYGLFFDGEYDGPTTTLDFANGTSRTFTNYAEITANFSGVDSGDSFFEKFCTGKPPASGTFSSASATASSTVAPTASGYPWPVVKHSADVVAGYFLNGTGIEGETAILSIPSFLTGDYTSFITPGQTSASENEFQQVVQEFLSNCTQAGKRKLIVDVRGNPGGDPVCAIDLFKQLFPSEAPWVGARIRDHESFHQLIEAVPKYVDDTLECNNLTKYDHDKLLLDIADYRLNLNKDNQAFDSPLQFYGPNHFHEDIFTPILLQNYSDPYSYGYLDFSITGYLNRSDDLPERQPFAAEDILVVNDGACGSSCAIMWELFHTQANISTLSMGGLPNTSPAAALASAKGALALSFDIIQAYARTIYSFTPLIEQADFNATALGKLAWAEQALKRAYTEADTGAHAASVNGQDLLRKGDASQVPVQFKFDEADARLFYTAEMVLDVTATWKGIANAWWGDAGLLVNH